MKIKTGIFLILCCLYSTVFSNVQDVVKVKAQGISCPFCVNALIASLKKLKYVDDVTMSKESQDIVIILKQGQLADLKEIGKTILDSGYTASSIEKSSINDSKTDNVKAHFDIKNQPCSTCHKD